MSASASTSKIGTTLDGRYTLDELIGEGAGGQVYRATHLALGRPVAVKLLLQEHELSDVAKARFTREAKTLAALRHPNIVTVIDFGVLEVPFLVLELVQGCELEELVAKGPLSVRDALSVTQQLLGALAYAHEAGVIHRDLKPSNLFVRELPSGLHIEVLDFGLAKFIQMEEAGVLEDVKVTRAGHIVGTPAYMAPEQCTGDAIDGRADQYAATIVLFEMLTGQLPFDATDMGALLRAHLATAPPTLLERAPDRRFSAELEALIQKGLAKDPAHRFANMSAMLEAVGALPELNGSTSVIEPGAHAESEAQPDLIASAKRAAKDYKKAIAERFATEESEKQVAGGFPEPPLALLVGTAVAFIVVFIFWVMKEDETQLAESDVTVSEIITENGAPPVSDGSSVQDPEEGASKSPWAEVPEELEPFRRALDNGRRLSRRRLGSLRSYTVAHPGDPRGQLLHGRAYVAQGWLSHALPMFIAAYETDPNARHDPDMLSSLLHMAGTETLQTEAANAVREIYGEEARLPLHQAITEEHELARRERLQALLNSL